MSTALALFSISAIVLIVLAVAGAAKMLTPAPTAETLASIGVRVGPLPVRLLGLVEVALAIGAAITASPLLLGAAALLHLGFTGVVFAIRRARVRLVAAGSSDAGASCGCFGSSSAAPGLPHIIVTVASAAILGATAALGWSNSIDPAEVFDDGLLSGILAVGLIGLGATMVILILTRLAELFDSFEPEPAAPATLALR